MRPRLADAVAFALLGFGASWTLSDVIYTNLPTFIRCLPGGLFLPDELGLAATLTQFACLVLWTLCTTFIRLSFGSYVKLISGCLAISIGGSLIVAFGWRGTVNDSAVVVIGVESFAASVGTLSWAAILPFISTNFDLRLVSAFFTGSASGSLVAGILGIVQGAQPQHFGPKLYLLTVFALLLPSAVAWVWILRGGGGRRQQRPQAAAGIDEDKEVAGVESIALATASAAVVSSGGAVQVAEDSGAPPSAAALPPPSIILSRMDRLPIPVWLSTSLPIWCLALPLNITCWGISPLIANFASAHAGCSCDPSDPLVTSTYAFTVSMAYTAMPLAGLISYLLPCHDLRKLSALGSLQFTAFLIIVCGASNASFMRCTPTARTILAVSTAFMRGCDTFITAMLFRIIASRVATRCRQPKAAPKATSDEERASLTFGQMLVLTTLLGSLLAVLLVRIKAIGCEPSDFETVGGITSTAAALPPAVPPLPPALPPLSCDL